MLINPVISVTAFQLSGFRHKGSKIYYYYDNWVGARAMSYFTQGASAWKSKTTVATINSYTSNTSNSYNVYMYAGYVSNVPWDGLTQTTYYPSTGYIASQTVTINMSASSWNDDGALKSVVVHEMGHVFGLDDNGKTKTIMNGYTYGTNSRYGDFGLTTPQTDDVNGVIAIYK